MEGYGVHTLKNKLTSWYKPSWKSLQHNCQYLREKMAEWGKQQIQAGTSANWNSARDNSWYPKDVKETNLWMDSVDFALTGKKSVSRRDSSWSYKKNSPGARFMCIMDGSRKVVGFYGPYSPKLYDSTWVQSHKEELEEKYKDGVVVADHHFDYGRKLKKIKFNVPYSKKQKLHGKNKKFSEACREIRGAVEMPFGELTLTFKNLSKPFPEDEDQLGYLVTYGIGIHNFQLNNQ